MIGATGKKKSSKGVAAVCVGAALGAVLSRVNQANLTEMVKHSKGEGDAGAKHEDVGGRASQAEGMTLR